MSSQRTKLDRVSRLRFESSVSIGMIRPLNIANSPLAGGALGWKTKGGLDPAFEAVAFELETSTTNNPKYGEVKTGFGYHIMMVEGRK